MCIRDRYQNFTVDKSTVIPDTCASFFSGRIPWPTQLRHENAPDKPQIIGPVICRSAPICAPRSSDLTAVLRKATPQAPRLPIANSHQALTAQLAKAWPTPIRRPDSKAVSTPGSRQKRQPDLGRRLSFCRTSSHQYHIVPVDEFRLIHITEPLFYFKA